MIWQALPCLATHLMFPQLDKAATQPQLLQEWFLVSQLPDFSNGVHMFEWYTSTVRAFTVGFAIALLILRAILFIKKSSGAYNQCS